MDIYGYSCLGHQFLFFWFTKFADPNFSKTGIRIKLLLLIVIFIFLADPRVLAPNVESVSLLLYDFYLWLIHKCLGTFDVDISILSH